MGMSSHELGHSMSECRIWVDVEYGVRVFAIIHTSFREDHGNEVDARGLEKRESSGFCEESNIDMGNITDYVVLIVKDG